MGNEKQLPRGVSLRGETINITFTFKGVRCREPLSNLPNTTANVRYASRLLGEIQGKIGLSPRRSHRCRYSSR